jgi:hypothetical protein
MLLFDSPELTAPLIDRFLSRRDHDVRADVRVD